MKTVQNHNTASDIFSKYSEKLKKLSEIFKKNPDIVLYYESWNKTTIDKVVKLTTDNFKFYLWQIFVWSKKWLYNEEFIIFSIKSLLLHLEKWEKLSIESASFISWLVNGLKETEWALKPDDQVEYIENIVLDNFPKDKDKIVVNWTHKVHRELYSAIEKEWLESLKVNINYQDLESFNSLDIARLLFNACETDTNLFRRFAATKENRWKTKTNKYDKEDFSNYYSLIEVSIRLTDYIKWVNIQSWEKKQWSYDSIITDILGDKYNSNLSIWTIKKLSNNLTKNWFNAIHIDKNKIEDELEKQNQKEKFLRNARRIAIQTSLAVSLTLASAIWWISWYKWKEVTDLNDRIDTVLIDALKDKTIYTYFQMNMSIAYSTDKEKIDMIKKTWIKLWEYFKWRYWEWSIEDSKLQLFFILEMISSLDFPHIEDYKWTKPYIEFIDKVLHKPVSKAILISYWFDVDKIYLKNQEQKAYFENTYNLNNIWSISSKASLVQLWEYVDSEWYSYDIAKYKCANIVSPQSHASFCDTWDLELWKEYIVAKSCDIYCEYNMEEWKKVSLDFLSSPLNNLISELISIWNKSWAYFYGLEDDIRRELVWLINKWVFELDEIKKWNSIDKLVFLQKFFPEKIWFNIPKAAQNTINLDDDTKKHMTKDRKWINIVKIWNNKDWQLNYSINLIKYKWNHYFYIDNWTYRFWEWFMIYWFDYNLKKSQEFSKSLINLL